MLLALITLNNPMTGVTLNWIELVTPAGSHLILSLNCRWVSMWGEQIISNSQVLVKMSWICSNCSRMYHILVVHDFGIYWNAAVCNDNYMVLLLKENAITTLFPNCRIVPTKRFCTILKTWFWDATALLTYTSQPQTKWRQKTFIERLRELVDDILDSV